MTREEKLEYIVNTYTKLMHQKAFSVLRDSYEAEDACQEAFLKLYRVLDRVSDVTTPEARSYCVMTAKNAAIDIARKLHHETPVEEVYDEAASVFDVYPSDTAELLEDLGELPDVYKDVIRLRCFEEKSAEETAEELRVSTNTVNLRLFRARKLLAKKWLTGAVSVLLLCGLLYLLAPAFIIKSGSAVQKEAAVMEEAACEEVWEAEAPAEAAPAVMAEAGRSTASGDIEEAKEMPAAAVIPETVSENALPGSMAEEMPAPGICVNSAPDYVTSSVTTEEEENDAVRRGVLILALLLLSIPAAFLIRRIRWKKMTASDRTVER